MADEPDNDELAAIRYRPLPVLRAMIDAVDRDVLQALARRNALVAEVAQYKRAAGIPVRDDAREAELLSDRCQRASKLGLSSELVESLYRLVLWGSRDRQASLLAQVPLTDEPKKIAIIGGQGAMGACMATLFSDLGHVVMIADRDTPLGSREAVEHADVVVISVPIVDTVDVIRELGPYVQDHALLTDVTSVKQAPVEAMLESTSASVVGTHPLFGPSVHSLQGQRVVMCPGRGQAWHDWLQAVFEARGLWVMDATAQAHDEAMAVVQVLVHFATEVLGSTLADLGTSIEETLAFTSPIYLIELSMAARHFAQSPDLYASIQFSNPATRRVTDAFVAAAQRQRDAVAGRDREAIRAVFERVSDMFGPFTARAMQQTSFLIDRIVERG
ncbi:MAG: bifunctional chorismate mutase/prephenate dehydrogenase [Myxococcales bacterium FL481]|nr:MAG: bifunctional chorismate mutase/prephenate dehydrogenase [Myxococcales bacterium FL481]